MNGTDQIAHDISSKPPAIMLDMIEAPTVAKTPTSRPDIDIDYNTETDYIVQIPPAVLDSLFRCTRCRHGATAHQQISDCIVTTAQLVSLAVQQGIRITPCPECGGPLAHSKTETGKRNVSALRARRLGDWRSATV